MDHFLFSLIYSIISFQFSKVNMSYLDDQKDEIITWLITVLHCAS